MPTPSSPYTFSPIGVLESCFQTKNGTPRQPGVSPSGRARLQLSTPKLNNPDFSLDKLTEFSHVWIIFVFHLDKHAQASEGHQAPNHTVRSKISPPRLGGDKVGVFATRSPHRPVPIGLSLVRLMEVSRNTLILEGIDLVDGTPVLDIKPYLPTFDDPKNAKGEILTPVKVPDWARPTAIFENDLEVCFTRRACQQLESIFSEGRPSDALIQTTEHMARLLVEVLRGDPRSRYRRNKCSDRLYFVELDGLHVTTWFDEIHGEKTSIVAEILRIRTSK